MWETACSLDMMDGIPPPVPFQGCRAGEAWRERLSNKEEGSTETSEGSVHHYRYKQDDVSMNSSESEDTTYGSLLGPCDS